MIACDLSRLNSDQRKREQELLGKFRKEWTREAETEDGVWFSGVAICLVGVCVILWGPR